MPDVFTKRKRSELMARIRGRGNKATELALAKLLRAQGINGWRRQIKLRIADSACAAASADKCGLWIEGKKVGKRRAGPSRPTTVRPDFVFRRERVAVFADGCFWHGCPQHSNPAKWLKKSSMRSFDTLRMTPTGKRTGKRFWREKLAANKARDRLVNRVLRRQRWIVLRLWEHELTKNPKRCAERIRETLRLRSG